MDHDAKMAQRMLKQLINDICDHINEEQAPPSAQELRNNKYFQGFRAGYREAYRQWGVEIGERMDESYEEGKKDGQKEEKEGWVLNHGEGLCASLKASTPRIRTTTDATTQAAPKTAETASQTNGTPNRRSAAVQTAPTDSEPSRLRKNAGMSTDPPSNIVTDPPLPSLTATSPPSTPAQPPSATSTSSTTTTTTFLPASKPLPASRQRRHTLPSRPPASLQPLQPLVSRPEPPVATAASFSTTATKPEPNGRKTTNRVSSHAKAMATTPGIGYQAPNDVRERSTARKTEVCKEERTRSLKRVAHSTERPRSPRNSKRRSRSPLRRPNPPLLDPPALVTHHQPTTTPHASTRTATSPSTRSTTTTESPALPKSGLPPAALKRRRTRPDPPERPQNAFQRPSSPQNPPKRTVSPPPASYSPTASLTTPSTPLDTPRPPSTPPFPPAHPSSPHLDCERPVLPPPARFDWADDAASLPTAPRTQSRDLSGLKTGCAQPFGTLRRRTRRRRAPPQNFSSRIFFHSSSPSHVWSQPLITRQHPSGIGPGRPVVTIPVGVALPPAAPAPKLDWDEDPRLADLSRALRALGWAPPR
jgi:hypothetical protein